MGAAPERRRAVARLASRCGCAMNPDVFITMAFAGIVALMALATLVFVVPKLRRADARAQSREGETGSGVGGGT